MRIDPQGKQCAREGHSSILGSAAQHPRTMPEIFLPMRFKCVTRAKKWRRLSPLFFSVGVFLAMSALLMRGFSSVVLAMKT